MLGLGLLRFGFYLFFHLLQSIGQGVDKVVGLPHRNDQGAHFSGFVFRSSLGQFNTKIQIGKTYPADLIGKMCITLGLLFDDYLNFLIIF